MKNSTRSTQDKIIQDTAAQGQGVWPVVEPSPNMPEAPVPSPVPPQKQWPSAHPRTSYHLPHQVPRESWLRTAHGETLE